MSSATPTCIPEPWGWSRVALDGTLMADGGGVPPRNVHPSWEVSAVWIHGEDCKPLCPFRDPPFSEKETLPQATH